MCILVIQVFLIILIVILLYIFVIMKIIRKIHPFPIPSWFTLLIDNPVRRKLYQPPVKVIKRLKIKSGMTCMEVGPGKGSYIIEMAKQTSPGIVYAVDISENVIRRLKTRLAKKNIENVRPIVQNAANLDLPDNSIDRILSIACLPEIPNPINVLKEWKRVLKPSGIISLSEMFPDPDYPLRRTEKRWAEEAGLDFDEQFGNWFIYGQK